MKRVIIESPFAGAVEANLEYARKCCRHSVLKRGESAWGSHLIWPQFLKDANEEERTLGIAAGLEWSPVCDYHVFYTDRGWSHGMLDALLFCFSNRKHFVIRALYGTSQLPPRVFIEELNAVERRVLLAAQEDFQDATGE